MAAKDGPSPATDGPPLAAMMVLGLAEMLRRELEVELAALDLTLRRYSVLGHIVGSPGMSYTELASRADVTVQTMFKLVKALEAEGLVKSQVRGSGRGAPVELELTARGARKLQAARRAFHRVDEQVFAGLTPEDKRAVAGILSGIAGPPRPATLTD